MQRNWTTIGASELNISRARVESAIASLEWKPLPVTMGACQGMGIDACIHQLNIPKVSHVAESLQFAPYGFYGIRAHYSNGDADVYVVDRGSDIIPVCSDFTPKGDN